MPSPSKNRTIRPILIGSILVILNIIWLIKTEVIWGTVFPTWLSLFPNVIFTLFVFSILSLLIERLSPRLALSDRELSITYVMLSIATAVFGRDTMRIIFHCMGAARWHATPENDWSALFWRYLPSWLTVSNEKAVESFYKGNERLHISEYIQVWAQPLLVWGFIVFVTVLVMACMSAMIRKQSVEYEHLSYPLIQLPLHMVSDSRSFMGNKLMWIGFAIGGGIDILSGLHFLYPSVPSLRIDTNIGRFFSEKPWSAIGWMPVRLYPFAVGLSYIMPLNLSFSCWLFYVLAKAQLVIRSIWGWKVISYVPYLGHQSAGAWLCIGITWAWVARRHIGHVFSVAMGRKDADDSEEAIRYKTLVPLLILGIAILVILAIKAGMAVWVAVSFFLLYFIMAFAVARMRAQLGPPTHDVDHVGPDEFLVAFVGTRRIGPSSLSTFPLFSWLGSWNYRALPIGHQLEGLRIAQRMRIPLKKMMVIMMITVALIALIGPWIFLRSAYQEGIEGGRTSNVDRYFYNRLENRILNPSGPDVSTAVEISLGFGITVFLSVMQRLFLFWPLHPIGYAISSGSYIMSWLWFSVFVGWLFKFLVLKYGGSRSHRRASFLFLGMILGQYVIGSLWTILGMLLKKEVYGFFP